MSIAIELTPEEREFLVRLLSSQLALPVSLAEVIAGLKTKLNALEPEQ